MTYTYYRYRGKGPFLSEERQTDRSREEGRVPPPQTSGMAQLSATAPGQYGEADGGRKGRGQRARMEAQYGPLLTGGQVAERVGIDATTMARWGAEGLVWHVLTAGGHRRYPLWALWEAFPDADWSGYGTGPGDGRGE